jgi:hypothetical protein
MAMRLSNVKYVELNLTMLTHLKVILQQDTFLLATQTKMNHLV